MNVQDVASKTSTSEDRLKEIFNKQRSLMEKYEQIEKGNGLLQTADIPVDIHDRFGQARLKDFAWRFTEELAEAMEAYVIHPELQDHVHEEVIDALHFLTELTILSGIEPELLVQELLKMDEVPVSCKNLDSLGKIFAISSFSLGMEDEEMFTVMSEVVLFLGCAMNALKNKPWKNTHMLTDVNSYRNNLVMTWHHFFRLCISYGMNADRVDDLYFRKNKVNQFRQETNY